MNKMGYVSVETHGTATVLLNGIDVSDLCFEADDQDGYVGMFKTDNRGTVQWPLERLWIQGDVQIEDKA